MTLSAGGGWTVILPVKALAAAKSRLEDPSGPLTEALAFGFFQDTLAAVVACPLVQSALVATVDERISAWTREHGGTVVSDEGQPGINAAAGWAARTADPRLGIAVVVSDLPCLTPDALATLLDLASVHRTAFLADADGLGTTTWTAGPGVPVRTSFGSASRAAHVAAGAADLAQRCPEAAGPLRTARRDVDTPAALSEAIRIGVGPHTHAILSA